jgi:LL-diaminopimelate aminotransferase
MPFTKSQRLQALPPYLFIEIDKKKRALLAAGKDVINLGVGDPDLPTHKFIIDEMAKAIYDPKNHRYPFDEGVPAFRQSAAAFMNRRFKIAGSPLDADKNILTTIGSKDGIAHLPLAVVNPGDVVLVPQPGYPVYNTGAQFAGGQPHLMPLLEKNDFLPDFDAIPEDIKRRAKLIWLNYPNNPTAATAPLSFYEKVVALAHKYGWVIANDLAYGEVYFEEAPHSILEIPGAIDVAIEFHSLSKSFNMTGWRIGWAAGNPALVAALGQVKGNVDSGQFNAIQVAGKVALDHYDHPDVKKQMAIYRERRDALHTGLTNLGWNFRKPTAGFFCWANTPKNLPSMDLCSRLIEEAHVVTVPGAGFGPAAEGFLRMALTVDVSRIREAVERIGKLKL